MIQQFHSGYLPEENKNTEKKKDICTPMIIAALFIIAALWKHLNCPSTDEWIKKMHIHIYSGILLDHKKERNWVIC